MEAKLTGVAKFPKVGEVTLDEGNTAYKKALEFYSGNITDAARALGITRSSLYRRIEKHKIQYES